VEVKIVFRLTFLVDMPPTIPPFLLDSNKLGSVTYKCVARTNVGEERWMSRSSYGLSFPLLFPQACARNTSQELDTSELRSAVVSERGDNYIDVIFYLHLDTLQWVSVDTTASARTLIHFVLGTVSGWGQTDVFHFS
jgi:hypothetical protein